MTMLIPLGAGLSPLKETGIAFVTRVRYVLFAGIYAIAMLTLTDPVRPRQRGASCFRQTRPVVRRVVCSQIG